MIVSVNAQAEIVLISFKIMKSCFLFSHFTFIFEIMFLIHHFISYV